MDRHLPVANLIPREMEIWVDELGCLVFTPSMDHINAQLVFSEHHR
jgi:hypothetical protein